jgi:SAM-dependent methyltransferase
MENTKKFYDGHYAYTFLDLEEKYNDFNKLRPIWIEKPAPMEVLDIGCGAGVVSAELVRNGHHVRGIDIMDEAVKRARGRGLDAIVHDLSKPLPYDDATFDAIFAPDILEHLFDPHATMDEMNRVMKDDAHCYIILPNHFDIKQRLRTLRHGSILHYEHLYHDKKLKPDIYFHIRFFNWEEVQGFVERSPFEIEAFDHMPLKAGLFHRRNYLIRNPRSAQWLSEKWPSLFTAEFRLRLRKKK